jgi:hypothetical protein
VCVFFWDEFWDATWRQGKRAGESNKGICEILEGKIRHILTIKKLRSRQIFFIEVCVPAGRQN